MAGDRALGLHLACPLPCPLPCRLPTRARTLEPNFGVCGERAHVSRLSFICDFHVTRTSLPPSLSLKGKTPRPAASAYGCRPATTDNWRAQFRPNKPPSCSARVILGSEPCAIDVGNNGTARPRTNWDQPRYAHAYPQTPPATAALASVTS